MSCVARIRRRSRGSGSASFRTVAFRVVHKILQLFTGLEEGNLLGRYIDFGARLGVTPDAPPPLPGAKASKSADLDFVALLQGLNDALENRLHNCFGLLPRKFRDTQHLFYQVCLRQCRMLGHNPYTSSPRADPAAGFLTAMRPPKSVLQKGLERRAAPWVHPSYH